MLRKSKLVAATAALSLAFPTAACAQEAETQIEPVKTTEEVEADVQAQTDETLSERRAELLAEAGVGLELLQEVVHVQRGILGVQPRQHAAQRRIHELNLVHIGDVLLPDKLKHIAEQVELNVRLLFCRWSAAGLSE